MHLVTVEKKTLTFPIAAEADSASPPSDTVRISNTSHTDVAFKLKTTKQARYIVRPNIGVIPRAGTITVLIGMIPEPNPPDVGQAKDKFLLLAAEAPATAELGLPRDYWDSRSENDPDVVRVMFRVQFVAKPRKDVVHDIDEVMPASPPPASSTLTPVQPPRRQRDQPPPAQSPSPTRLQPGLVIASSKLPDAWSPHPSQLASSATPPSSPPYNFESARNTQPTNAIAMNDVEELLQDGNYEQALLRVRELQSMLDSKTLELARLRTELAETRAESLRVLREAPKTPLSANKILSDPFGGVSIAGFGLMLLLFLILVNFVLRTV